MTTKREHDAWLRVQQDRGWRYGEEYSEDAKTDPRMVPFENLTAEQDYAAPGDVVADEPVTEEPIVETVVEETTLEDLAVGEADPSDAPQEGEFNG